MAERAKRIPNVVSIAGVDPSGGAGILADVKTMSACGVYACGVVTALTAQNTRGVFGISGVPADFVSRQMDVLFEDVEIDAVKIGMLADAQIIEAVAEGLEKHAPRFVVVDPVMVAKSGDRLLEEEALNALRTRLLPIADVITPNLPEALELLGLHEGEMILDPAELTGRLSEILCDKGSVLLKGGHMPGDVCIDYLYSAGVLSKFEAERFATKNTHGTGCALSSALAAYLALTGDVRESVSRAKTFITGAIINSERLDVGSGHGPTHAFWNAWV